MPGDRNVYRFGPYELDAAHRRLKRGRERMRVPARQLDLLCFHAANPHRILAVDTLMEAIWRDQFVSPNSVVQIVKAVRKTLGKQADGREYIETVPRQGYMFDVPVTTGETRASRIAVDELLAPHRTFVEGRALFETLDLREIARARDVFEAGVVAEPEYADALIGLANVLVLQFEATRDDERPPCERLERAERLARHACVLEPDSAEALATLGFILHRRGDVIGAIAAIQRALKWEPDSLVHLLRLAYVSWGEMRLRAAARVLRKCPGLALAFWLQVTVLITRRAFPEALALLHDACAAQDRQSKTGGRFHAVGLHLRRGLILAASGDIQGALEELARELELADDNHVYGRECRANTWYAIGALRLRLGQHAEAAAAFRNALAAISNHHLAKVGLAAACGSLLSCEVMDLAVTSVDEAMVKAAAFACLDRHGEAASLVGRMLTGAPAGAAAWQLPVEPMINVAAHPAEWADILGVLHDRAL